jgi:hypothetical protein
MRRVSLSTATVQLHRPICCVASGWLGSSTTAAVPAQRNLPRPRRGCRGPARRMHREAMAIPHPSTSCKLHSWGSLNPLRCRNRVSCSLHQRRSRCRGRVRCWWRPTTPTQIAPNPMKARREKGRPSRLVSAKLPLLRSASAPTIPRLLPFWDYLSVEPDYLSNNSSMFLPPGFTLPFLCLCLPPPCMRCARAFSSLNTVDDSM